MSEDNTQKDNVEASAQEAPDWTELIILAIFLWSYAESNKGEN